MKQLRKITAAVLAMVLALGLFTGCARAPVSDEKNVMAQDWENYLAVSEQIHTAFQWAFSYAAAYSRENDWESLLKARAAASAALIALQQLELPECTLTDEQYDALLAAGIEADVVMTEYAALSQTLQTKVNTLNLLNLHLTRDIFLLCEAEMFADWVQSSIKIDNMDAQYIWHTTNYLLLQLEQQTLWDSWLEEFPGLGEDVTQWQKEPEALMVLVDSLLDDMSQELVLYQGYLGTSEYGLEIVGEAVNGDMTALSREINRIEGVPGCFPVPEWLPDVVWRYFTKDGSGEMLQISVGDEITDVPDACYIPCTGVSLSQAKGYAETLKLWGLTPYETEENGTYQMLVEQGDSQMFLEWTEDAATLYFPEPVGSLIPSLYLSALFS